VATVVAQDMGMASTATASLSPVGSSAAAGQAWVVPVDEDHMVVTVALWGLEPGSAHSNHIHRGSCAATGGIDFPLTDLSANDSGWATASTIVNTTLETVASGHYVMVHTGILGTGPTASPGISCGDVMAGGMMTQRMMMLDMAPMPDMDHSMMGM
jgi:hypothetical protein